MRVHACCDLMLCLSDSEYALRDLNVPAVDIPVSCHPRMYRQRVPEARIRSAANSQRQGWLLLAADDSRVWIG